MPSNSANEATRLLPEDSPSKQASPDAAVGPSDIDDDDKTWMRVLLAIIIPFMGIGFQMNVIPQECVRFFGDRTIVISTTSDGIAAFCTFLFSPIMGSLSDKYGRVNIMCLCMFLFTCPTLPLIFTDNMWWYIILRPLGGIGQTLMVSAYAYVTDWVPEKQKTYAFGLLAAAMALTFVLSPFLGAGIAKYATSPSQVWVVAALLALLGVIYSVVFLPEREKRALKERDLNPLRSVDILWARDPKLPTLAAILVMHSMVFMGMVGTVPTYSVQYLGFDNFQLACTTSLMGLLLGMSALAADRTSLAFGNRNTLAIATLGSIVLVVGESFARSFWGVMLPMTGMSLTGMTFPTVCSLASSMANPDEQGAMQGALLGIKSLADGTGPILLAQVVRHSAKWFGQASYGFLFGLVFVSIQIILILTLPRHIAKHDALIEVDDNSRDSLSAVERQGR